MRRKKIDLVCEGGSLRRRDFCKGSHRPLAGFCLVEAPFVNGRFLGRMSIRGHVADPQMVVRKDLEATFALDDVMFSFGAPAHYRLLVPPGRMRQDPAGA